ncbi:transposase, IS605 OrfB family [Anaerohalosphaera lusitana]|uniref:Transposase, IS605 OrfB family n=1 Tax=Anaerohalosphaera lusitana TaxID=1936003 RepID=A0A1U9NPC0_9BACT|nr:IS200/IS605 family accessory protein TnpB-related protein [Anaerohalosphaera lusitana]AQT69685.1 transposase, IS605 OrfB family [Anaerohalosphaera lusitana]
MATKSYRARILTDSRLAAALDRTHVVFVESLKQMINTYLRMQNGKFGPDHKKLAQIMLSRSNTFAHGVMDQITRDQPTSTLDEEWTDLARRIHKTTGPLFLQAERFATVKNRAIHTKSRGKVIPSPETLAVPAKFWHQVCDSASAYIRSNRELMQQWRKDRAAWLKDKNEWQQKHPEFMQFYNGPYQNFLKLCDDDRITSQLAAEQQPTASKNNRPRKTGKRFARWHLWYKWLSENPEIIEWRNKASASDFKTVTDDVRKQIITKYPQQNKYITRLLDWLEDNNPELKTLENLRRTYVKKFDSFKRPPTLTLPSPYRHPYWFTMELDQFYKKADFENGTIQLLLIDEDDDGNWFFNWMPASLKPDPRLVPSWRAETFETEGRFPPYLGGKIGKKLSRPAPTDAERKAGIAGAKLMIKNNRSELLFTVFEQDCPPRVKWAKTKNRKCPADNAFSSDGKTRKPLRILSIDLGIRHIGAFALTQGTRNDSAWQTESLKKGIINSPSIPPLRQVRRHDYDLKRKRRRHGKPVKGQRSNANLQAHRTNMAQDRFKKGASAIVSLAREHSADLILFENLHSLKFSAFDERWMNRQLRDMNRRHIVELVSEQAPEFGITVKDDINPWMTSRICSNCNLPGFRFSMKKKNPYREKLPREKCTDFGYPVWEPGGHLFRCPHCDHRVNADINAAANLANKFFGLGYWNNGLKYDAETKTFTVHTDKKTPPLIFKPRPQFDLWADSVKTRKQLGPDPF